MEGLREDMEVEVAATEEVEVQVERDMLGGSQGVVAASLAALLAEAVAVG